MTPDTFKDYLRLLYSRLLAAAGIATGAGIVGIVLILVFGGWAEDLQPTIVRYLGTLAIGGGVIMAIIIGFLGLGGPAQSFKFRWKDIEMDTQGDADA